LTEPGEQSVVAVSRKERMVNKVREKFTSIFSDVKMSGLEKELDKARYHKNE
jgi:hypothetical protein